MALAAGDIFEVAYFCRVGGKQNCVNVMHYRVVTPMPDPITTASIAPVISGLAGPVYRSLLHSSNTYDGVKVRIVRPTPTAAVVDRTGSGVGSNVGIGQAPTQLCVVGSLRAATAPPRSRGRQYFGGFTNSDIDGSGDPTAGVQALVNTILNVTANNPLVLVIGGVNYTVIPVIWKRGTGSNWDITSRVIRIYFGTQRRRSEINRSDAPL